MVRIYAHRGASAEVPENTLAAFALAVELKADGIELDVHLSKDGELVVIHDESVDRTTNGTGALTDLTLTELKALDAGSGEQIPTLAEVLDLVEGKLHVDIEVKANAAGEAVLNEVRRRPNLDFAISSFDHSVLRHIRSLDAEIELWPLTVGASDDAIQAIKDLGAPNLAIWDKGIDQDIVGYVRENGAACWIWTVNDVDRAREIVGWDIAGICTDDPRALIAAFRPTES